MGRKRAGLSSSGSRTAARKNGPKRIGPLPNERFVTVIAQDPSVRVRGRILRARIAIPAETLQPGPVGYRVRVIDYDATHDTLYSPQPLPEAAPDADPFEKYDDSRLERDPVFHRHNAYALVMRTLARFELALGRRIGWGFKGHQLTVAPHAFADANAFYSEKDQALLLGYFPGRKGMVYTTLAHDVIVHETTHALVDGLRERYTEPSSPDQAAFHEGFADVVAILSVFSLRNVIEMMIDRARGAASSKVIEVRFLTVKAFRDSAVFGLAEQVGAEISASVSRGRPLRRSLQLLPDPRYYLQEEEFKEAHRRGEILVAAVLNAFIEIWIARLAALVANRTRVDRARVVEEGADIADCLLTSAIRALDYAPPVDITFGDYLSAFVTADREIRPGDTRYELRKHMIQSFGEYGIEPASGEKDGYWIPAPVGLDDSRTHFESMRRDPDEVFHFIWENRTALKLHEEAYTRVTSVRPCARVGPDGFILRETVCEYLQILEPLASELPELKIRKPRGMPNDLKLKLFGGGILIFDEYGRLKFHVYNPLSSRRQTERIRFLWEYGFFRPSAAARLAFSSLHRRRAAGVNERFREEW
jgi:hypothetical protein